MLLKVQEHYSGKDQFGYKDLDIENIGDFDDQEIFCKKNAETIFKKQLNKLPIRGKSVQEIARVITSHNHECILNDWYQLHLENISIKMKQKKSDILVSPTDQIFVQVAKYLGCSYISPQNNFYGKKNNNCSLLDS